MLNTFKLVKESEANGVLSSKMYNNIKNEDSYEYDKEAAAVKNVYVKGVSPKTLAILAGLAGVYYAGTQKVHENVIGFGKNNVNYM